jgi:uncharacterized membrane protein YphA (DoxX/SURF4 family)
MRQVITICKYIVGIVFIFSGLVKANDPLGLSYKMQEFFEAWNWHFLHNYTLQFAYIINIVEVVAGIALLINYKPKITTKVLLALIVFFTFLTAYVLFSGKIKACGCFGDCIPLTPNQTFIKDLVLLALILLILFYIKYLKPLTIKFVGELVVLLCILAVASIQSYVLINLPFADCLPYQKGNDILQQMKVPAGSTPDSIAIAMIYTKNGKQVKIWGDNFPEDFDSTYQFVSREDVVIRKGNAEPAIKDFTLTDSSDIDVTATVFSQEQPYIFILINELKDSATTASYLPQNLLITWQNQQYKIFVVTSDVQHLNLLKPYPVSILKCDATVLKTASRSKATYLLMNKATIINKLAYTNAAKLLP